MISAVTDNLYEYKKDHPLGEILLFDDCMDVMQRADVQEIRQALAFVLKGGLGEVLEGSKPMVMFRTQRYSSDTKKIEEDSATLRARWAADILDEFGSDIDGNVLIHTGSFCSYQHLKEDISQDVSNIVRVVSDSSLTEAILYDGELHIPAHSSLSAEDVYHLSMGKSVNGAEQHLAAGVIKSLQLESIVAIKSITRTKTREEVLELVKHAIDNPSVGDVLLVVLREICRNDRQDLLPDLMAIAKSTTDIRIQSEMLKCCSKLYPSSLTESYVDSNVDMPLDDEYSRRYLEQFKNTGEDFFRREGKGVVPCSASEEIFVDQINKGGMAFFLEDRPGKPQTVWIFKDHDCGHVDSEFDILLNLATLELYKPNVELIACLSELNRVKPGEVIRVQDLDDSVSNQISFYRLAYCVNGNVKDRYGEELVKLRGEILGKYVPIQCENI